MPQVEDAPRRGQNVFRCHIGKEDLTAVVLDLLAEFAPSRKYAIAPAGGMEEAVEFHDAALYAAFVEFGDYLKNMVGFRFHREVLGIEVGVNAKTSAGAIGY